MKKHIYLIALAISLFSTQVFSVNVEFSGYGSIVAGKTFGTVDDPINIGERRDEIFTADFYDVGQYNNDFSFKPETVFALQAKTKLSDNVSITAQLVSKAVDEFSPDLDWFYLTYKLNEDWTFMAGRRNIPMYYFSEFSEVGYAYPWIRPPANLYWWQVTQFNAVQALYTFVWGEYNHTVNFFYGNEYSKDNKEMLFYERLYGTGASSVDEFWTDITGFNWNVSGEYFDVRFVYFVNDRDRDIFFPDGSMTSNRHFSQSFIGFGGTINLYPLTILFDYNFVDYDDVRGTEFPTYLISLAYSIDEFQPYISYSKADHERTKATPPTEDLEEHYLLSVGLRYDFIPTAAFKIQLDKFVDQGHAPTGWNYHGDSTALTFGVDFIF
ncbi:hypothetical protein P2G88_17710 [Aliiglaciecola sp. CAU 1673]|uniref:hypothetical protein n=1 Tax=Aliiglaciecola sp. CAU 1673 TaxID=3032595 RepID=UPI0023D9D9CB|nr:hypothetical protein [Aliiglaciecola sp. CAU 1673]MDF2180095.1 hypothetical protein [Aliiglaciecola sp. CAU 1673]